MIRSVPPMPTPNCVAAGTANVPVPDTPAMTSVELRTGADDGGGDGCAAIGLEENVVGSSNSERGMSGSALGADAG